VADEKDKEGKYGKRPSPGGSKITPAHADESETSFLSETRLGLRFAESISEPETLELRRETEPLRTAVMNLLQSDNDLIPDEVWERTRVQLEGFEMELNRTGGALGGIVRSYWLSLSNFVVTYSIRPELGEETIVGPLVNVLDSLDVARSNADDPDAIRPVLNAVAELASADTGVQEVSELLQSVLTATDAELNESKGLVMISGAIAAAVAAVPTAGPIAAVTGSLVGAVMLLVRRTYQVTPKNPTDTDQG